MKLRCYALVFLTIPLATAVFAAEPTAAELAKIKADVEALDVLLNGGRDKNNLRALAQVQSAMGSTKTALEFYMEAKKEVDYLSVGKKESDFREWRDANEERLKSPEYLAALQYQLRYLALTLQATSGDVAESKKKAIPSLIGYLDDLGAIYEKMEGQTALLKRSVLEGSIAEYLKLDITVNRNSGWPLVPGDVPQIYETAVLPHYRDAKDSAGLQAAWDKRIAQEAMMLDWSESRQPSGGGGIEARIREMFDRGGGRRRPGGDERDREREEKKEDLRERAEKEEQFKEERLPELQWSKFRDGYLFGAAKALALGKMSAHVRANLGHPLAGAWLEELKGLVDGDVDASTYYDGEKGRGETGEL